MSLAGKTLKELHQSLMHVNCIDQVIATIKAATIKNKDRKKDFHDARLQSPPDTVITR